MARHQAHTGLRGGLDSVGNENGDFGNLALGIPQLSIGESTQTSTSRFLESLLEKKISAAGGLEQLLAGHHGKKFDVQMLTTAAREILEPLAKLSAMKNPAIFICGGARMSEDHWHFEQTYNLGSLIAQAGLSVITGGGPGAMKAANQGAFRAPIKGVPKGESVAVTIEIKHEREEQRNPFVDIAAECKSYFFPRKLALVKHAVGAAICPGGMGTLDELFEMIKLSNNSSTPFPIPLVGEFYKPLYDWLTCHPQGPVQQGRMKLDALRQVRLCRDENEAADYIIKNSVERSERWRNQKKIQRQQNEAFLESVIPEKADRDEILEQFGDVDLQMVNNILGDLLETFRVMSQWPLTSLSFLGSSRPAISQAEADLAYEVGAYATSRHMAVLTAQATGLMGDANRGASDSGGISTVCNRSRRHNDSATAASICHDQHTCTYDLTQRVALVKYSRAAVFAPGGIGTLDHLCEVQNLIMTNKLRGYPVSLLDTRFWNSFLDVALHPAFACKYIDRDVDLNNLFITDSPFDAVNNGVSPGRLYEAFKTERIKNAIPLPIAVIAASNAK